MLCNLNLTHIEKKCCKKDKFVKPAEWVHLIENTLPIDPFCLVFVEHPLANSLKPDHMSIVTVKDYNNAFLLFDLTLFFSENA